MAPSRSHKQRRNQKPAQREPAFERITVDEIAEQGPDALNDLLRPQLKDLLLQIAAELSEKETLGALFIGQEEWLQMMEHVSRASPSGYAVVSWAKNEYSKGELVNESILRQKSIKLITLYLGVREAVAFSLDCAQAQYFLEMGDQ